MRTEIRTLLTRTGISALFVTHDQAEAFAVADRVALLNAGRIEQIGPPDELYEHPATRFAASFLGGCNLIEGRVLEAAGGGLMVDAFGRRLAATWPAGVALPATGARVTLAVRPHHIEVGDSSDERYENRIGGTVAALEYFGWLSRVTVSCADGGSVLLEAPGRVAFAPGDTVALRWRAAHSWAIAEAGPS
ncbi:MAG: TOBE domain-containing protein [Pseudomonadota bacterium]